MALPLTPDQQAKLDQFESDAQTATQAAADSVTADADLIAAQDTADQDKQNAVTTLSAAMASAQAFIDSMLNPPAGGGAPTLARIVAKK